LEGAFLLHKNPQEILMKIVLVIATIAVLLFAAGCRTAGEVEIGRNAVPQIAPAQS
jgi:hypothetical protein